MSVARKRLLKDPAEHLPLSQVMDHMLMCLTPNCALHGYAIKLEIRERTHGRIDLDLGTTYAYLKKMLRWGIIYEAEVTVINDKRRRTYRLSKFGE